jgi:hypothetical protein
LAVTGLLLWENRVKIAEKVIGQIVAELVERTFESFPDAYMTYNRDRVLKVFDDFTNAAAGHRIKKSEYRRVGAMILGAIRDGQLSYAELDSLLSEMEGVVVESQRKD